MTPSLLCKAGRALLRHVGLLLLVCAGAHASAAPQRLPAALDPASEIAALPAGNWLTRDKRGLQLRDAAGQARASVPLRAQLLDLRPHPRGALAVVLDADAVRVQPYVVDIANGQLDPLPALTPGFDPEALCLYRDEQALDQLFLIAKDGRAEQWLLDPGQPRLLRRLALPPRVEHCRVDDARHTLYAGEPGLGLWAYQIAREGIPARQLVLAQGRGGLAGEPAGLLVLPGGVAVADPRGARLHLLRPSADGWQRVGSQPLAGDGEALVLQVEPAGLALAQRSATGWVRAALPWRAPAQADRPLPVLTPRGQTESVARAGDAADDPAIWVHPQDPARSRLLATNKKQGLLVYDLQGREQQLLQVGRLNNVDLRRAVQFGGASLDLAVATQRDDNSVVVFEIDAEGRVSERARLATGLEEIYGVCLYQPPSGGLQAFVNDKDGRFLQLAIEPGDGGYRARRLRSFQLDSQPEGCVADDRNGRLFLGEEKRGVWVLAADPAQPARPRLAMAVGRELVADVEGMALYHGAQASYLVVSSQGNDSYVVLDALPPYRYRGAFRVGINVAAGIDGASETDGLDVVAAPLGGPYSQGLLVVQDGYKLMPEGNQNFKLLSWADVARALGLR